LVDQYLQFLLKTNCYNHSNEKVLVLVFVSLLYINAFLGIILANILTYFLTIKD